jgi:hypothetical protein
MDCRCGNARLRRTRSLAVIRSTCTKLATLRFPPVRSQSPPITSTNDRVDTAHCSTKKLHRNSRSASAAQPVTRVVSNQFTFGVLKRTAPPALTPSKEELAVVDAPEPKVQRCRSFEATFSLLQSRHGRDRLGSRLSTLSTSSGASASR